MLDGGTNQIVEHQDRMRTLALTSKANAVSGITETIERVNYPETQSLILSGLSEVSSKTGLQILEILGLREATESTKEPSGGMGGGSHLPNNQNAPGLFSQEIISENPFEKAQLIWQRIQTTCQNETICDLDSEIAKMDQALLSAKAVRGHIGAYDKEIAKVYATQAKILWEFVIEEINAGKLNLKIDNFVQKIKNYQKTAQDHIDFKNVKTQATVLVELNGKERGKNYNINPGTDEMMRWREPQTAKEKRKFTQEKIITKNEKNFAEIKEMTSEKIQELYLKQADFCLRKAKKELKKDPFKTLNYLQKINKLVEKAGIKPVEYEFRNKFNSLLSEAKKRISDLEKLDLAFT